MDDDKTWNEHFHEALKLCITRELQKLYFLFLLQEGNTALMYAAYGNHPHCAHELLTSGVNFTAENSASENAFDVAIRTRSKLGRL